MSSYEQRTDQLKVHVFDLKIRCFLSWHHFPNAIAEALPRILLQSLEQGVEKTTMTNILKMMTTENNNESESDVRMGRSQVSALSPPRELHSILCRRSHQTYNQYLACWWSGLIWDWEKYWLSGQILWNIYSRHLLRVLSSTRLYQALKHSSKSFLFSEVVERKWLCPPG